jgi:type II secretory pathway pseudopilin PulG
MKSTNERGFALIDLVFVCGIIGVLASIAMPRMLLARQTAGAASAIGALRAINSAQLSYAFTCGSGFYAPDLMTLGTPPSGAGEAFVPPSLGFANAINQSGYRIQLTGTAFASAPASCNGLRVGEAAQGFKAGADPLEAPNKRYFATNAMISIYEDSVSLWTAFPENGEPLAGHPLQ